MLRSVLSGFEGLETPALLLSLEHRNSEVRLRAMKLLHGRGALNIGMVERLTEDRGALVRNQAVAALLELGKRLGEEEIKKILITPHKQPRFGLLGLGSAANPDKAGEDSSTSTS